MANKPIVLDFTNVKEGGARFTRTHKTPGDYEATVIKAETVKKKSGEGNQWLFTLKIGAATYPYYCQLEENVLWKVRGLFAAAGIAIPSKRVKLSPDRVVGKKVGVSLDDDEYDGKLRSSIMAVMPLSELEGHEDEDSEDEEDDEEEETEEENDEEEEEEDEEEEEEEPPPPPKKSKKNKAKTKRKASVDDEELEELDIEDI